LLRSVILAAHILFALAGTEIAIAGEMPPAQPAPTAEPTTAEPTTAEPITAEPTPAEPTPAETPPPLAEPVPADTSHERKKSTIEQTIDRTHEALQRKLLAQVIRLDDFFGNAKTENRRQTEYEFRLRNSIRVETGGNFKYGPSIRAHLVLSKISERLRLSISGDNSPVPVTPSLPEDPGNPGFDRTAGNTRLVNTELRYALMQTPSVNWFMGAGIQIVLPPEVFARSRFQYTHHLSDISLVRFGETFFVRTPDGPGETTELDLERLLNPKTLLRWSSIGTASYGIRGFEWGSELSLIHELSPLSAITLMGGIYGNTSLDDVMGNYRLLTRYRRNFMRSWLFYELEPELFWPRRADGKFPTNFSFTFRIEVVFKGIDPRREENW